MVARVPVVHDTRITNSEQTYFSQTLFIFGPCRSWPDRPRNRLRSTYQKLENFHCQHTRGFEVWSSWIFGLLRNAGSSVASHAEEISTDGIYRLGRMADTEAEKNGAQHIRRCGDAPFRVFRGRCATNGRDPSEASRKLYAQSHKK